MEEVDTELQNIIQKMRTLLPNNTFLDLAKPLKECLKFHYKHHIEDFTSIYSIFRTNKAYSEHKINYIVNKDNNMIKPNINHKFFTTDTPFGLCLYKDLGEALGILTPCIDKLIEWNQNFLGKEYILGSSLNGKDSNELLRPSREYLSTNLFN